MPTLTVADQVTTNAYLEECHKNQTTVNVSNIMRLLNRSEGSRSQLNDYIANWMPLETTLVMPEVRHDTIDVFPIGQMVPIQSDSEVAIHYLEVLLASRIDEKADLQAKASYVDGTILLVQEILEMLRDSQ